MHARDIRITGVNIHELAADLPYRFGWSLNWTSHRTATLIEVTTNAGLTGWGDGFWGRDHLLQNPHLVIGRSPFEVEAIFDDLRPAPGHQTRPGPATAGGLDVALWDLCGKILGQPVSALLGQRHRHAIQPYLTALYRQDWPDLAAGLAAEARDWKAQGWRYMKMKIGYGPETDLAIVRAVREAVGPEVALSVDANCAYDAGTAIALARQLEPFHLMWWEEPLLADDLAGYARLRAASRIPLASGETLSTDRLITDYLTPPLLDILQPDIETVGFTGGRRLSYLCWLHRVRLIPHNWGTAVRTAAVLHWMAITPPLTGGLYGPPPLFEFDQTPSPFRDPVIRESIRPAANGLIPVPTAPGLGIEVLPDAVAAWRSSLIAVT